MIESSLAFATGSMEPLEGLGESRSLTGLSTALPAAWCELDESGRILAASTGFIDWPGLSVSGSILGTGFQDLFVHPLSVALLPPPGAYRCWLRPWQESATLVMVCISPLPHGGATAWLIRQPEPDLGLDEEAFRVVSQLTADFVHCVLLGPEGELSWQWATLGMKALSGYDFHELEGLGGWGGIVAEEDRDDFYSIAEELRQNGAAAREYRIHRADGAIRWVRDHARAEPERGKAGSLRIYGAISDITAEYESSRALSLAHADLEARVAARTVELSLANQRLVEEVTVRRQAEARAQTLVRGLSSIFHAASGLLACSELDSLYLQAIQFTREQLGVERCSIYLIDAGKQEARGTFGVDRNGEPTDEHHLAFHVGPRWQARLRELALRDEPWEVSHRRYTDPGGEFPEPNGSGEIASTPIFGSETPLGVLFNDNALTGTALNPVTQQLLAVFCTLLGPIIERKQAEQRQTRMVEGLHAVVDAADELLKCETLDKVFRRAVELARERFGLERAAIFCEDPETGLLQGTFGTDEQGRTTDERSLVTTWDVRPSQWTPAGEGNRWRISHGVLNHWDEGERVNAGWGWRAWTPISAPGGRNYHLFNDTAITNSPLDPVQQEIAAVYCFLLGGVLARKSALMDLRRSGQYYRALIENGSDVIAVLDPTLCCRMLSPSLVRVLGFSPDARKETPPKEWCHPDDLALLVSELEQCRDEPGAERRFDVRFRHQNGEWRHLAITATNLLDEPSVAGVVLNAHDVTERLKAQRRLENQSQVLELIAGGAPLQRVMEAVTGFIASACSPMGASVLELQKDGMMRYLASTGLPEAYLNGLTEVPVAPNTGSCGTAAYLRQPVYVKDIATDPLWGPWKHLALDNGLRACWSLPVLSSKGELLGTLALYYPTPRLPSADERELVEATAHVAGIAIERAAAEEQLHLIQAAVEQSTDAITIMTASRVPEASRIVYVNPAFCQLSGYPPEEVLGQPPNLTHGARTQLGDMDEIQALLERGETYSSEFWRYRKDGSSYLSETTMSWVRDASGTPTHAVSAHRDVTARREMEDQLRHSQKMEAIGRLAGGMAHDFNNMLAVISGYTELLQLRLPPEAAERRPLTEIARATERATDLTRRLLAFSRKSVIAAPVGDVGQLVLTLEDLLQRLIGEDVELQVDARPGLGGVALDADQLEQILINLAVNARDAMPDGGHLRIRIERQQLAEGSRLGQLTSGTYVVLVVTDTGTGMDEATRARAFEPFFTTKEAGRGTGLGLPMVYGCVRGHHGFVELESEVGQGTTFRIYLPLIAPRIPETAVSPREEAGGPGGTETILLVEDEGMLRALLVERLRNAGYTVLATEDGEAALKVAETHSGRIDLVVTDVIMPRLGGRELVEKLLPCNPDLRVLYMTGHTEESLVSRGMAPEQVALLRKPFRFEALLEKLREVLDSGRWSVVSGQLAESE